MDPIAGRLCPPALTDSALVASRLERGEFVTFASCPFPLPEAHDRTFLFDQRLDGSEPRHISYDPRSGRIHGCVPQPLLQPGRLQRLLGPTADQASRWLEGLLPCYAGGLELDYVAYHPEEEATRTLATLERNDLLHIDVPPSGSDGRRLLRLYVNLHATDTRVWQTSLPFAELLERYGREIGVASPAEAGWWQPLRQGLLRLLQGGRTAAAPFEDFMLRLHDFLKEHDAFQERAPKKCWQFGPGACWLIFTDGVSHAELRGRFVLEFAFLVARRQLACPEASPYAQFERACGLARQAHAA